MASWISQNDTADGSNDYKTFKNVGIGTSSPSYPLDVVGRSFIRGANGGGGGFWSSDSDAPGTGVSYIGRGDDSENHVGFYSNGDWRLVIKDSGNVGIGTTGPGSKLAVSGGVSIGANYADDAAPSNGLIVEGQVGIGVTSPSANTLLEIVGENASAPVNIRAYRELASGEPEINLFKSYGGSFAAGPEPYNGSQDLGGIRVHAVATDHNFYYVAGIDFRQTGNPGSQSVPSSIRFRVASSSYDAATQTPVMTLDGATNYVGIGTESPAELLDVAGAICIQDGMTAPSTHSGKASIYIDSSDGDLKIKFGDGTVKTIVTD